MTTSDWALIISLSSFVVSLAGFVWNVWSKFVYPKAKVRVYIGIFETFTPGIGKGPSFINMTATNFGPGEITLTHAMVREPKRWPFHKGMDGLLKLMVTLPGDPDPLYDVFGNGQLPKKLAVGEQMSVRMNRDTNLFADATRSRRIGFSDSFGRFHWANLKVTRKLKNDLEKKESGEASAKPAQPLPH